MTSNSTYQAARITAPLLEKYFEQYLLDANPKADIPANFPKEAFIEHIIDAAFWASLRTEEGRSPKISIAFLSPEQAEHPLLFGNKLRLNPKNLTKLAPGVEGAGIHLGVWYDDHGLFIWGTTLAIPNFCFVLDVSEPALLVIKHRRLCGFGKYTNVAILKGDEIKIVNENSAYLPDSPQILNHLLGLNTNLKKTETINVMIQLAVGMRNHKRGGIILIVPKSNNEWKKSIIHPIQYFLKPAFKNLSDLIIEYDSEVNETLWESKVKKK